MVIRKGDRVSAVIRRDESLIEVFVSLSPAFERLRNAGMRRVMSRLVTVEQAARMAGVDADELVDRLNGRLEDDRGAGRRSPEIEEMSDDVSNRGPGGAPAPAAAAAPPPALARIATEQVIDLDVREDLRAGREPFNRIMAARREVSPGGALVVRAIFEPVPLYAVMEKQGLAHWTERLGDEDWRVWFYSEVDAVPAPAPAPGGLAVGRDDPNPVGGAGTGAGTGDGSGAGDGVVVLDVRGLEPPEPMMRTLAALEALPAAGTLVQINVRVPQFLLPQLEERGFTYEIREQGPGLVRLFIRRAAVSGTEA